MLGSSASAAMPNVVLNTITASVIDEVIEMLEKTTEDKYESKIKAFIKDVFKKHSKVIYGENGYSQEWIVEAEKRGLPNYSSSIEAISHFDDKKNVKLLTDLDIYTASEIEARKTVLIEQYISSISLEVKTLLYMAESYVIPAIAEEVEKYATISTLSSFATGRGKSLATLLDTLSSSLDELRSTYADIMGIPDELEKGIAIRSTIVPLISKVRATIDTYEKISSRSIYTIPTYPSMLY